MREIISYLKKTKKEVDKEIEKYLPKRINKKWLQFLVPEPEYIDLNLIQGSLIDPSWELLDRGGKRWRPALFFLIVKALKGNLEKIKEFAILPELIHEGTLIIDDIEDKSELRRGKPSLHKIFGIDIALNAGNFLYFLPLLILREKREIKTKRLIQIYQNFIQEMVNLSLGQAIDISWTKKRKTELDEKKYLTMCAFKTGCLSRFSAKLAAILCGKRKDVVERFGKLGEAIGVAFQIQDDILDVTLKGENRQKFGKVFAQDITEGKKTLLVIHTLKKANSKDKKELLRILEKRTEDKREKERAVEIMEKYNAIEYAKNLSKRIVKKSWEEIERFLPETKDKRKLKSFIFFLIERKL